MAAQGIPLVSIVVPAYNVERYLDECVQSIVNQTYSNIEVVIVDDGSKDATPRLCDAWATKDDRVRVIHTDNHGLAAARNTGFADAVGEWTWFVDSDDYIAPEAVQHIVEKAGDRECDLIAIGMRPFDESGELPLDTLGFKPLGIDGETSASELEKTLYEGKRGHFTQTYVCRTGCLRAFGGAAGPFDEDIKLFEDVVFIHQYLRHANTVAWIDEGLYWYRQTPGSLLHQGNAERAQSGLRAMEIVNGLDIASELAPSRKTMLIRFILSIDTLAGDSEEAVAVRGQARSLLGKVLAQPPKVSLPMGYRVKCTLVRMGLYQPLRKALIRLGVIKAWNEK